MAPTKPAHKHNPSQSSSAFASTKKDKRQIKRSNLLYKVAKSSAPSSAAQRNKKRRQKKTLVTNLQSLGDALPASEEVGSMDRGTAEGDPANRNVHVIRRSSMKSRPGAMKRREKIDRKERERFGKNMNEMAGKGEETENRQSSGAGEQQPAIAQTSHGTKWAALRGFIAQTLEIRP